MIGVQLMLAVVGFQPDSVEAGAFHGMFDLRCLRRTGNGITCSIAQKEWNTEKCRARFGKTIAVGGAIVVTTTHENANDDITLPDHLRSGHGGTLSAAGKSGARKRPMFGLRPGTADLIEKAGNHPPGKEVVVLFDRDPGAIDSDGEPVGGESNIRVPGKRGTRGSAARRRDEKHRPGLSRIETLRQRHHSFERGKPGNAGARCLDDRDAIRAIDNLGRLCEGALYLEALTERDWRHNCDRTVTDGEVYLRPGSFYRTRLARHFHAVGGGVFVHRRAPVTLFELETLA